MWKLVTKINGKPKLDSCRRLKNGDLLLRTGDIDTSNATRCIPQSGTDIAVSEPGPMWPKIIIRSVPSDYEKAFVMDPILSQNSQLENLDNTAIRNVFKWGPRNKAHHTNWVSPETYKLVVHKRL